MKEKTSNYYDPKEEKINVLTHGFGVVLSIIALVLLVLKSKNYDENIYIISCIIYGVSMIILYMASTLFHASKDQQKTK